MEQEMMKQEQVGEVGKIHLEAQNQLESHLGAGARQYKEHCELCQW